MTGAGTTPEALAPRDVRAIDLGTACRDRFGGAVAVALESEHGVWRLGCPPARIDEVCAWLAEAPGYVFATLVVEESTEGDWLLSYVFHAPRGGRWARVEVSMPGDTRMLPTISDRVHAADWHERETEDLFGLQFEGHPKLGEFVLHEDWPEGVNPMRRAFDGGRALSNAEREPEAHWQSPTIVDAPGAFAMPVGPVFSDFAESAHFLLETVGEDVIVTVPRLFYKYRGVEKSAEGCNVGGALLLAERFSGSSAFAHGLAYCQALERICAAEVPPRACALRTLFAELERLRHHVAAIAGICGSTALVVAQSQAAILEEELLRITGMLTGHRYLFGLLRPGGLAFDPGDGACRGMLVQTRGILARLRELEKMLRYSSSFLDRLEEVGIVTHERARSFGLVGPVARASGISRDMRKLCPYADYEALDFEVPAETEGDGYARLRILFREAGESQRLIEQLVARLPDGPVAGAPLEPVAGAALGWVEAPRGAAFHWVRLDAQGRVCRYRITTPSFTNWHGFHLAAESFAFQDFPIILASFGLSNAECDR